MSQASVIIGFGIRISEVSKFVLNAKDENVLTMKLVNADMDNPDKRVISVKGSSDDETLIATRNSKEALPVAQQTIEALLSHRGITFDSQRINSNIVHITIVGEIKTYV